MTNMTRFASGSEPPAQDTVSAHAPSGRGPGEAMGRDYAYAAQHYAAIVESSEDAILSKDLDGVILTWNLGAERLFGYTADEAVGKSVTIIIPADRLDEEPGILAKIRSGERIHHFETVRRRKDGSLIDISLTISPIRDLNGRIVGASKIARDISELKRTQERQQLLLREMNHRVKNLFALTSSIIGLSARSAKTAQELAVSARERVAALARAHALTFSHGEPLPQATTLQSLIRAIVAPFDEPEAPRIIVSGVDVPVSGGGVASLALLLHEFATNAAKYGALSSADGTVAIDCREEGENAVVTWTERGGPRGRSALGRRGLRRRPVAHCDRQPARRRNRARLESQGARGPPRRAPGPSRRLTRDQFDRPGVGPSRNGRGRAGRRDEDIAEFETEERERAAGAGSRPTVCPPRHADDAASGSAGRALAVRARPERGAGRDPGTIAGVRRRRGRSAPAELAPPERSLFHWLRGRGGPVHCGGVVRPGLTPDGAERSAAGGR